jgi:Domain of unknown function (DUF4160)
MGDQMAIKDTVSELQRQLAQVDLLNDASRCGDGDAFELLLLKRDKLKFKMYQESKHKSPHIHIDYGHYNHVASYLINPAIRLKGDLERRYDKTVIDWISTNREILLAIWADIQTGAEVRQLLIELTGANS